jgi:tRNA nucleotidyltransferase (CCA-adding enzyme)
MTADFDTLGAAVGITRLRPGCRIVLAGGCHPGVQAFLALHRDEYGLIERRAVAPEALSHIAVVDTQQRDRLGPVSPWLELGAKVSLWDHHMAAGDVVAEERRVEAVGAATTLVAEQLQARSISLTTAEATVMALGIHSDTGSLTFEQTTVRDALALAWLMEQGASQRAIADFTDPGLSPTLQDLLTLALESLASQVVNGHRLGWVVLETAGYVPGLSTLTARLMSLTELDALLVAHRYPASSGEKLVLIGRARAAIAGEDGAERGVNFHQLFSPLGGGGHPTAAAASLRCADGAASQAQVDALVSQLLTQVPPSPTAQDLMSSPVRTIRPHTTIGEAQRILLRYGHSGLSVVNAADDLVGIISRRDIDLALHHGFSHAPVKGYMTTQLHTIDPQTPLSVIESLMVTYDVGRLPVIDQGRLVGIVTRTDVLRQLHPPGTPREGEDAQLAPPPPAQLWQRLQQALAPGIWQVLGAMAQAAADRGWHLYLVGGAVRDLLLSDAPDCLRLQDIDLVVDGFYQTAQQEAGVTLAQAVQAQFPEVELQVYGRFQTAALVWPKDSALGPLMVDVATARTEFYPYPAANPEVEASSIRQDLYRRDFTINAMALRLTPPQPGMLLDFFGGSLDLAQKQVRVLHANSFIEDPTRIYRAVRFAVRLGFTIDPQTEGYIRHAIASGIYADLQAQMAKVPALQARLRQELKYILQAPYWQAALALLDRLNALQCLHSSLTLNEDLWHQLRRMDRWLTRFDPAGKQVIPWQIRLEVVLCHLATNQRGRVASMLQLPQATVDRLGQLAQIEADLIASLPQHSRASQIYSQLQGYDWPTLLLVSVRRPRLGRLIWRYLTQLATVSPPLDGNDLKQLGYRPGPEFRAMLTRLLAACLDGEVCDRTSAIALIQREYPLPPSPAKR